MNKGFESVQEWKANSTQKHVCEDVFEEGTKSSVLMHNFWRDLTMWDLKEGKNSMLGKSFEPNAKVQVQISLA